MPVVWDRGSGLFHIYPAKRVQGEYTQSFKSPEERAEQVLANRERAKKNPDPAISQSDKPELAETLYDNAERQALYSGDLDPEMISAMWVNRILINDRKTNGEWERLSVGQFINEFHNDANMKIRSSVTGREEYPQQYYDKLNMLFKPNEDLTIEKLKERLAQHNYSFEDFVKQNNLSRQPIRVHQGQLPCW